MKDNLYINLLDDPNEQVVFQYVPENIQHNRSAKLASIDIPGRSNPILHYTGGADSVSFELKYQSLDQEDKQLAHTQYLKLQEFSKGQDVVITFGGLFQNKVWKLEKVGSNLMDFSESADFHPQRVYIKLDFKLNLLESTY